MSKTETPDDGRNDRQPTRTFFEIVPSGDGWKATEPASDSELYGRGETRTQAIKHYVELIEEGGER